MPTHLQPSCQRPEIPFLTVYKTLKDFYLFQHDQAIGEYFPITHNLSGELSPIHLNNLENWQTVRQPDRGWA